MHVFTSHWLHISIQYDNRCQYVAISDLYTRYLANYLIGQVTVYMGNQNNFCLQPLS